MLMLAVTACYTITSLSDKHVVGTAKFTGDEFTFLLCSSMSVFLMFSLPFQRIYVQMSWQAATSIILVVILKMLEFQMSACVLRHLSAFELKAWLGVTLFVSYLTDVFFGASLQVYKIGYIALTVLGLFFIVKSTKEHKIDYRKIFLPLFLYLFSKFSYGLVIKGFTPYVSSGLQITIAMIIISLVLIPRISIRQTIKRNPKVVWNVILARIPNTVGMLLENVIISISLTNYSFIQPMILVSLFIIGFVDREKRTKLNFVGSVLCMIGIVLFQIL